MSGSAAFLALPLVPLTALLSSDRLAVDSEMRVWEAVAAWIQHSPADRATRLTSLIGAPIVTASEQTSSKQVHGRVQLHVRKTHSRGKTPR